MRWDVRGSCCRCGRGGSAKAKQGRGREGWYFKIEQVQIFQSEMREKKFFRSGNSLYELLDIPKDSTPEDIKKKYRRLALKYDLICPEQNRTEIPQLQVSPWQKSWQCRGRGDVQEDQQCQRYPEVCLVLIYVHEICIFHTMWKLKCSEIPTDTYLQWWKEETIVRRVWQLWSLSCWPGWFCLLIL